MSKSSQTSTFDTHCHKMEWNAVSNVKLVTGSGNLGDADLVVICVFFVDSCDLQEHALLKGWAHIVDQGLKGALQDLLDDNAKAIGTLGSVTPTLLTTARGGAKTKRYALLSLGKEGDDLTGAGLIIGRAIAAVCCSETKVVSASIHLPDAIASNAVIMRDLSTGFYEQLYTDNRYRTGDNIVKVDVKEVRILTDGGFVSQDPLTRGKLVATGVILAKDIVNAPHNVLNPESLTETAKRVAKESRGRIKCEILGKKECQARGMSVVRGHCDTEPHFIHLTYTPADGKINKKVGVVGEGWLFDKGGYNTKTGMMELMQFDCGGAAVVLGAARAVGELEPPGVEVNFIVAARENMISSKTILPSDILAAANGKTIEVLYTDTQGHLTLADALVISEMQVGCESIAELSALTGACTVALDSEICGLWTDDDAIAADLAEISKVTGGKSLRMSMTQEYREQLKSKFADLQNICNRHGSSITTALFLQNVVDEETPISLVHIAGHRKTEATGFGAKMIVEWISRQAK